MNERVSAMDLRTIQDKLATHTPSIIGDESLKRYSLLIPLMEQHDELHILFEVRSYEMRRQPGEICFPGGKMDGQDSSTQVTAIRETSEELGISFKQIKNVQSYGYMVSPFGMKVDVYVGFLDCKEESFYPNKDEVAALFTVPLDYFLKTKPELHYVHMEVVPEESFPTSIIPYGENYQFPKRRYEEYFYHYHERVIWGLTARVLYDFIKKMT